MRIIDKDITGNDLSVLADEFFYRMNQRKKKTGDFYKDSPAGKLLRLALSQKGRKYGKVVRHLANNLKEVFTAAPGDLLKLHAELAKLHGNEVELSSPGFKAVLRPVFGYYDQFRKSTTRGLLHDWLFSLKLTTCPYCNRDWISHIGVPGKKDGKFLFDVDHFFPKSKYPYFALSFYNLIPSCTTCNQRLKRDRDTSLATHIHPYVEDLDRLIRFDVPVTRVEQFYKRDADVPLRLKRRPRVAASDFKRAEATCDFFKLQQLYETHKDYARELMQKGLVYSESQVKELWDRYGGRVFQSKAEIVQMIMGNYVLATDIHKRPLAKMTKDLAEQFDLYKILQKP